ncbi:hypothetical protein HLH34_18775 [Gluconacetobacter azotocaptans]|uniref:Apea-like HEPN domain-containing protein n=1 Tax=Gluconacetobacter azotocaptans TaxID=142834 RepID=A0A7W4JW03_9PROT|nr:hypothetical protein [Gluconacetobacter azotocaptans]MBB2191978.1 hypothetical protein [Gluconacetobacter azotocaptans]GBQ31949.1 hypothetical protein AA13594_2234 [Gluconacetobacter azotocaptans DSM 13594]
MLQINSGKLYPNGVRRTNELRGVLYSNLLLMRMEDNAIVTQAGRLLQAEAANLPRPIVYEVSEQFDDEPRVGVLISHGVQPYLQDFAAVVSFVLRVTCTPDPDLCTRLLSDKRSLGVMTPPAKLVRKVFDKEILLNENDDKLLNGFIDDLIGLRRKSFLAVMRAIRTYVTGLHRVADDLELAYTLMVASLESLAQDFDGHTAQWSDYEQGRRQRIDKALKDADEVTAGRVRDAILKGEHVALKRRFREFVLAHLPDSYFLESGPVGAPGRLDLRDALKEAYDLRSKYVHRLQNLPQMLDTDLSYRETIRSGHATFLTLEGLARVARHVILEFVTQQPKCQTEDYDYRLERFGIMSAEMAPQYWIWQQTGFVKGACRKYFSAQLGQVAACMLTKQPVTNMREICAKIEEILPRLRGEDRRASAAIYILFNQFVQPDERSARFAEVYERCRKILSDPSIEALCLHLLFSITPTWPIASQREVLDSYFETRNQKSGLRVPELFEAAMVLSLAERYRGGGDIRQAKALLDFAAVNILHVGSLAVLATDFDPEVAIDWRVHLLLASFARVPEDTPEAGVKAPQAGSGPLPAVEVGDEVDQSS